MNFLIPKLLKNSPSKFLRFGDTLVCFKVKINIPSEMNRKKKTLF